MCLPILWKRRPSSNLPPPPGPPSIPPHFPHLPTPLFPNLFFSPPSPSSALIELITQFFLTTVLWRKIHFLGVFRIFRRLPPHATASFLLLFLPSQLDFSGITSCGLALHLFGRKAVVEASRCKQRREAAGRGSGFDARVSKRSKASKAKAKA